MFTELTDDLLDLRAVERGADLAPYAANDDPLCCSSLCCSIILCCGLCW